MAKKKIKLKSVEVDGNIFFGESMTAKIKKLIKEIEEKNNANQHTEGQKEPLSKIE